MEHSIQLELRVSDGIIFHVECLHFFNLSDSKSVFSTPKEEIRDNKTGYRTVKRLKRYYQYQLFNLK